MKISDASTPLPAFPDVSIPSDESSDEIDDTEMGDFLFEALSDFQPIEGEHDAFLDALCED